jgi:hypothetical protein
MEEIAEANDLGGTFCGVKDNPLHVAFVATLAVSAGLNELAGEWSNRHHSPPGWWFAP